MSKLLTLKDIKFGIMGLPNSELYDLKEMLDLEIKLSEEAITEGQEERKWLYGLYMMEKNFK